MLNKILNQFKKTNKIKKFISKNNVFLVENKRKVSEALNFIFENKKLILPLYDGNIFELDFEINNKDIQIEFYPYLDKKRGIYTYKSKSCIRLER